MKCGAIFAKDAKLTDAQWDQRQRDLSELAAVESAAYAKGIGVGYDGTVELSHALEAELLERCAAHMTKDQMA